MLTAEKLAQVNEARGQSRDLLDTIEALMKDEPVMQPPTTRTVALEKIASQLDEIDATLDQLWS